MPVVTIVPSYRDDNRISFILRTEQAWGSSDLAVMDAKAASRIAQAYLVDGDDIAFEYIKNDRICHYGIRKYDIAAPCGIR